MIPKLELTIETKQVLRIFSSKANHWFDDFFVFESEWEGLVKLSAMNDRSKSIIISKLDYSKLSSEHCLASVSILMASPDVISEVTNR